MYPSIRTKSKYGFFTLASIFTLCGSLVACGVESNQKDDPFAEDLTSAGKGDMLKRAQIIDDINLNSTIDGAFNDRIRVYGFTVEAKAGATLNINITALAGAKSSDVKAGDALDTVAAVYGPMTEEDRGPRIAYSDDVEGDDSGAAQLPALNIVEDGKYMMVLSSWSDPGNGRYKIKVGCEGTDFQCRRPVKDVPCEETTRYITGGTVIGTEEWNQCNVVLLERLEVESGAVLTVRPGVKVQGNYIGADTYGTVELVVNGTLQSVGTKQNPVVFTSLKNGWKGLVLNGSSNTLEHTFVDKAYVGITLNGANNSLSDLNISVCDTGLHFTATSKDNEVNRIKISQVRDGINLEGAANIKDSVIRGLGADGTKKGSGIWGHGSAELSRFHRALIADFPHGLYLTSIELEVHDSTIVNNARGIFVTGENAGIHPAYECPAIPNYQPPQQPRPQQPTAWGRDPVFIRCDIIGNTEYGIKIAAPELLVVEKCNVRDNGAGIIIESDSLHDDSRITQSNIFRNGDGAQVDSFHVNGLLDISGNYWAQLSDPELSASWQMNHSQNFPCSTTRPYNGQNGCSPNNGTWDDMTCGVWKCRRSGSNQTYSCTASSTKAIWNGNFTFTGFSPIALPAGPELTTYVEDVTKVREELGL